MKQQKAQRTSAQKRADRRWVSPSGGVVATVRSLPVTYVVLIVTTLVSLLGMAPGLDNAVQGQFFFNSAFLYFGEYWRMLSVTLVHGGPIHLALNMLSLWMLGRVLEPLLGSVRFFVLYAISAFAGSVAMVVLAPGVSVVGASGAIFGIFGALFIILRTVGADVRLIIIVLAINAVIGFVISGIAWQAHLGGAIGGALVGYVYSMTRKPEKRWIQVLLLLAIVVALGLVTGVAAGLQAAT